MQPEEIKEAKLIDLDENNVGKFITRPHMKSRTIDAMEAKNFIPYESWKVNPYRLLNRIDN